MTRFEFYFKNINNIGAKIPQIEIRLNDSTIYTGQVKNQIVTEAMTMGQNKLEIAFVNKVNRDTIVNAHGDIVKDLNFELDRVVIDHRDIEHLIWDSHYRHAGGKIDGCLFFGPLGSFILEFETPVLKWMLKTNHEKNNNDPEWEEDYNYYTEAWNKIHKK